MYKSSLVLEGGGLRGVYTAGVLDAFMDKGIEFHTVVGSSAGSCNGSRFVAKDRGAMRHIQIDLMNGTDYCGINHVFKHGTYVDMDYLFDTIPFELQVFPFKVYNESKTKCYNVVTNIVTGEPEYLEKSKYPGIAPVRASSSLPLAANIVQIGNNFYMDGGLTDSIPFKKGLEENEKCLVITTRQKGYKKKPMRGMYLIKRMYGKDWPNFINALKQRHKMYNKQLKDLDIAEQEGKAFVIYPSGDINIGRLKAKNEDLVRIYQMGYDDAQSKMDDIIKFLEECGTCEQ